MPTVFLGEIIPKNLRSCNKASQQSDQLWLPQGGKQLPQSGEQLPQGGNSFPKAVTASPERILVPFQRKLEG